MSDSDNNNSDDVFDPEDQDVAVEDGDSEALEAEEEQKETLIEEQPQISIERVDLIDLLIEFRMLVTKLQPLTRSRMRIIPWAMH
jgi:hypothetical protein